MCSVGRSTMAALTRSIMTPERLSNLLDWLEPPHHHLCNTMIFHFTASLTLSFSLFVPHRDFTTHITFASLFETLFETASGAQSLEDNGERPAIFETVAKGDRRRETRSAPLLASERQLLGRRVAEKEDCEAQGISGLSRERVVVPKRERGD